MTSTVHPQVSSHPRDACGLRKVNKLLCHGQRWIGRQVTGKGQESRNTLMQFRTVRVIRLVFKTIGVPPRNSLQPRPDLYFSTPARRFTGRLDIRQPSPGAALLRAKGCRRNAETILCVKRVFFFTRECFGRITQGFAAVTLPTSTASPQMHKFPQGCLHSESVTDVCFFFLPRVFVCVGGAKVQYGCKSDERARAQSAANLRTFYCRPETPKRTEGEQQPIELACGDPAPSPAN